MTQWLRADIVLAIHSDQLLTHGGSPGTRDRGALESALARPRNRTEYDDDWDIFDLAAKYGYGIAQNHPFVDGNKRVALAGMVVFLLVNGWALDVPEPEAVIVILDLASGNLPKEDLANWLRAGSVRRPED